VGQKEKFSKVTFLNFTLTQQYVKCLYIYMNKANFKPGGWGKKKSFPRSLFSTSPWPNTIWNVFIYINQNSSQVGGAKRKVLQGMSKWYFVIDSKVSKMFCLLGWVHSDPLILPSNGTSKTEGTFGRWKKNTNEVNLMIK